MVIYSAACGETGKCRFENEQAFHIKDLFFNEEVVFRLKPLADAPTMCILFASPQYPNSVGKGTKHVESSWQELTNPTLMHALMAPNLL